MSFRLNTKDETVAAGLRRVVTAHIDAAIADIDDPATPVTDVIHSVRKRCKKIRSLIRLAAPRFKAAGRENERFGNVAAALSESRDATVLLATADNLAARFPEEAAPFAEVRALLRARTGVATNGGGEPPSSRAPLEAARAALSEARKAVDDWRIKGEDADVLGEGIERSLTRARRALKAARKTPDDEEPMHTLRKRAKDLSYQTAFLRNLWPGPMKAWCAELTSLAELLGDEHDLSVFIAAMEALAAEGLAAGTAETLASLAASRKAVLGETALALAERALAGAPAAEADKLVALFDAWRAMPDPLAILGTPPPSPAAPANDAAATEIERKFLVTGDGWRNAVTTSRTIRQGYLCHDGAVSLRVRVVEGKSARLGVKSAAPELSRTDVECKIALAEAEALLALPGAHVVEKIRHTVPVGAHIVEVDEYRVPDDGLVIAEIEMASATETPPAAPWIGAEVTGDARYYAATIAGIAMAPSQPEERAAVAAPTLAK